MRAPPVSNATLPFRSISSVNSTQAFQFVLLNSLPSSYRFNILQDAIQPGQVAARVAKGSIPCVLSTLSERTWQLVVGGCVTHRQKASCIFPGSALRRGDFVEG